MRQATVDLAAMDIHSISYLESAKRMRTLLQVPLRVPARPTMRASRCHFVFCCSFVSLSRVPVMSPKRLARGRAAPCESALSLPSSTPLRAPP